MSAADTTTDQTFTIEWDMGDYPGFPSYEAASRFQREHRMTGSVIVPN